MKKTSLIAAVAAVFIGSVAQAGNFDNINRAVAIPAFNQGARIRSCEIDLNLAQGHLASAQSELTESQNRIRMLEDEIQNLLTPGTCENTCINRDITPDEYGSCVSNCNRSRLTNEIVRNIGK